jgi:hypothetical protein
MTKSFFALIVAMHLAGCSGGERTTHFSISGPPILVRNALPLALKVIPPIQCDRAYDYTVSVEEKNSDSGQLLNSGASVVRKCTN